MAAIAIACSGCTKPPLTADTGPVIAYKLLGLLQADILGAIAMAGKIFISYRRDDSAGAAGRLHDRLERDLGRDLLFMDVDAIPLGQNFAKILGDAVAQCDVFLAVIGKGWLDARDEAGRRRLDDPNDFVRIEIATALKRGIPVVPILLDGATLPAADQLPDDLNELPLRNGLAVRHASFHADLEKLLRLVQPSGSKTTQNNVQYRQQLKTDVNLKQASALSSKIIGALIGCIGTFAFLGVVHSTLGLKFDPPAKFIILGQGVIATLAIILLLTKEHLAPRFLSSFAIGNAFGMLSWSIIVSSGPSSGKFSNFYFFATAGVGLFVAWGIRKKFKKIIFDGS